MGLAAESGQRSLLAACTSALSAPSCSKAAGWLLRCGATRQHAVPSKSGRTPQSVRTNPAERPREAACSIWSVTALCVFQTSTNRHIALIEQELIGRQTI